MPTPEKAVFFEGDVERTVLSVIEEAQRELVIVTPYLNLWEHAKAAIERARQRKVSVTLVIRAPESEKDFKDLKPGEKRAEDIEWLRRNDVRIVAHERLHAKIYLNERTVVLSSMNFTRESISDSFDFALVVRDRQAEQDVRQYVLDYLLKKAIPFSQAVWESFPRAGTSSASPRASTSRQHPTRAGEREAKALSPSCIRCGRSLSVNLSKPLCDTCYDSWQEYQNEDYPEKFCHACGRPSEVSYARPLCRDCYRRFA